MPSGTKTEIIQTLNNTLSSTKSENFEGINVIKNGMISNGILVLILSKHLRSCKGFVLIRSFTCSLRIYFLLIQAQIQGKISPLVTSLNHSEEE